MNKSVLEKAMGLSIWTPKLWILLGSSLDPCSLGGIFDCKQDRLIWTSPKSATKLSFLGLDKIETYCSPFLRCFPLQRMENPSYQNSKPMCQCVFLDFKSGCLKIHGRTNLEPTFSPRFHSLEYLEFLWRHQFAKFSPSMIQVAISPWNPPGSMVFEGPRTARESREWWLNWWTLQRY